MLKFLLKTFSLLYVISVITVFLTYNYSNLKKYFLKEPEIIELTKEVQIWSKAAIGEYLWSHILNGSLDIINNGFYQNGNVTIDKITFSYFSGPGYIQTTVPQNVEYLTLVLNGRTYKHTVKAKEWLDYIPRLQAIKKLAVILLGSENCEDEWVVKYLKSKGGIIDVLFIVYDSPLVDNKEVFQWPLGVATYRGFPNLEPSSNLGASRKYICNFMGTVYKNSSREKLVEIMSKSKFKHKCFIRQRDQWLPQETSESLNKYVEVLNQSLLTLSPAGKNPECYRLYEAISLGSTPVVVMEASQGQCVNPPLRLLYQYKAPIIKFSSWENAIHSLESINSDLIPTSSDIISWYSTFKKKLSLRLVQIINEKFYTNNL